jgi:DNA-directed RNA polymerase specialized sigma24 family protein
MSMLAECQTRGFQAASVPRGIEKRILFLDPADRKLLELTLQQRLSRREIGLLVGLSAGQVTRRVHTLLARLDRPVVRKLVDDGALLPDGYRAVAIAHFLRHESLRELARRTGLSLYEVRRIVTYVKGWHNGGARARDTARRTGIT